MSLAGAISEQRLQRALVRSQGTAAARNAQTARKASPEEDATLQWSLTDAPLEILDAIACATFDASLIAALRLRQTCTTFRDPLRSLPPWPLSDAARQAAIERFEWLPEGGSYPGSHCSNTTALRALLTHDSALGGVPIRLLSARRLLTDFGGVEARLKHRRQLEQESAQVFVSASKVRMRARHPAPPCLASHPLSRRLAGFVLQLERIIAELESGNYSCECDGELRTIYSDDDATIPMYEISSTFSSAVAVSFTYVPAEATA